MKSGTVVEVADAFENTVLMRIVGKLDSVYLVCRDEEFIAAEQEKRPPVCAGVSAEFIRKVVNEGR